MSPKPKEELSQDRILIVDDEKHIVGSLKDILADEGYDVSVAEDGLDALDMIQSDPPDLLLLDIWLPGMDGIEVLKTVKTDHPDVEVLIMSGHGTIDTAVKATKLGAYDFIEKPFSLDHLTQSVESVLKLKKAQPTFKGGKSSKHSAKPGRAKDPVTKPFTGIEIPSAKIKSKKTVFPQRTLKHSVVLCGSGLHSGIKTGLILQPLPPDSGIIFGDISSGQTIPAQLENIKSTNYSTSLKKGRSSVATIEHIMAVLHMYRITNLLIKIGDEVPVMDGSAKDFCELVEDGEFEDQDEPYQELVVNKTYSYGSEEKGAPFISIEPSSTFKVTYHMEYPAPIDTMDHTFEYKGEGSFKKEIAPARTFGFMEDVAQLTSMGFASGGKLDNFILLGNGKIINTKLRFKNEFPRHKILDIIGDFYLLGRPIRGHIRAHKTGHTQNVGLLKILQKKILNTN
jgi:UDP-3-O-acyl N-acetylglucosamine deacetylase